MDSLWEREREREREIIVNSIKFFLIHMFVANNKMCTKNITTT